MATDVRNVVIIGSGPAGLTAALYTARAGLEPLLIEGLQPGGQLTITTMVENWPGFRDGIMGPQLMAEMRAQAERFGTAFRSGIVSRVELGERPFTLHLDGGDTVRTRALIVATGASAKMLGIESEMRLMGRGVSTCATCDGFFFRGKQVIVVGGGNTAVEEALYLANIAAKVTLIHRRDELRAERILQDRLFRHPRVEIIWDTTLEEICGEGTPPSVTHVRLRNVKTGAVSEHRTDGVFIAIGHKPASDLFVGQLDLTPSGYIRTEPGTTRTNIEGVFAAGDVTDEIYRQAVTAAGFGCMAALDAERWLASREATREAAE